MSRRHFRPDPLRVISKPGSGAWQAAAVEDCSAFTRVAARTLAPSSICDPLHRRLQLFRHLHDCSGCFRLERRRVGLAPTGKRRLVTAHTSSGRSGPRRRPAQYGESARSKRWSVHGPRAANLDQEGRSRARHSLRPHKLVVPLADRSRAGVTKVVQVNPERLTSAQGSNRRDDRYREGDRPDLERNVC